MAEGNPPGPPTGRIEYLTQPHESSFPEEWYELSGPGHFWFQWRLAAVLRQAREVGIPIDRPLRVLDVGAGGGILRDQLESCTPWVIDIADLNVAALERAHAGRGRTLCYDVLHPDRSLLGAYDLVLLFDVLEHIAETRPFLDAVLRHVRPGGHLVVNVPAWQFLFSAYDTAAGHVRRYERRTLALELAGTGTTIRDTRYWGMVLVPLLILRKWLLRGGGSADERVRRGFQPPGRVSHAVLRGLQRLESSALARPPFGSSLLLAAQAAPA
jgi:2-polyprenyl-3-methyl-5-hydroxy-6-metoxy-1,4-benzoquinol methylase